VAALSWYVIRLLSDSNSERRIFEEAICILSIGVVGTTVGYCLKSIKPKQRRIPPPLSFTRLTRQVTIAVFALLVILAKPIAIIRETRSPGRTLQRLASLDPQQLEASLPVLRLISKQPVSKVSPNPAELRKITETLSKMNPSAPDYWPTVLTYIEFASTHYAPNAPRSGGLVLKLRNNIIGSNNGTTGIHFPRHSTVEIDGDMLTNETFIDSRIIFTGTPSTLINVKFINCVFEFRTADRPNQFMKGAARQLLASGIQTANIERLS
jgi:hypothetical protein